jgi:hypothetical protein
MPWSELFLAECSRLENSPTIETDARKRRSNGDVENALEGVFNNQIGDDSIGTRTVSARRLPSCNRI